MPLVVQEVIHRSSSAETCVRPPPGTPLPAGSPALPPRQLTLQFDAKSAATPFHDKDTASRWDIAGRAVEGQLKGWTLRWLDSTQVKWFAWAAEYPETSIYRAE